MPLAADAVPAFVYAPEIAEPGAAIRFGREDSHYLLRVCRVRAGQRFSVTDGRGRVARVVLVGTGTDAAGEVEAVEVVATPPAARLLCGAPEGERADWLVEKLVELGVTDFVPVDCERGPWERFPRRSERLRRVAVAALRQCRRAHLLEIHPVQSLAEAIAAVPPGGERWLASEGADLARAPAGQAGPCTGVVGPSAGLSESETASCIASGFEPISLAGARLRTETAALAMAAWWAARTAAPPRTR